MEGVAPILKGIWAIQYGINSGKSLARTIKEYLEGEATDEFEKKMKIWLSHGAYGKIHRSKSLSGLSLYQEIFLEILEEGLLGGSIQQALFELEKEVREACAHELTEDLQKLPIKMLIPVMLLQFPSFLILLFYPVVFHLAEGIQ